ncbi:MAG TPA: hypothetical protein VJ851_00730 [Jatrophihabitans sp.]|nr:hypothetical protein [Jatrophihabitans sp.]
MSPRTGRPPSGNPRTHAVPIRLTDDELTELKTAADRAGMKTGEYIRQKALAAAKRSR